MRQTNGWLGCACALLFAYSTCDAAQSNANVVDRGAQTMHANEGYVTTSDGVRLYYVREGNGPSIVIVPNAIYMREDLSALAAHHSIVFYDLRNRGRSDSVSDADKLRRGVHHDVEDLETIRASLGLREVSIVAHSYASVIAALYAMKHPEHVARIVQISPPPPQMDTPIPADQRYADATSAEMFTKLQALQTQPSAGDPVQQCRAAWNIMRPFYVGRPEDAAKINHWGFCDLANERDMLQHWNRNILPSLQALKLVANDYAKVRMPVLIIHGTRDRSAPYGGAVAWARELPDARLLSVEGAGHVPYLERPEIVLPALATFLTGSWPGGAKDLSHRP